MSKVIIVSDLSRACKMADKFSDKHNLDWVPADDNIVNSICEDIAQAADMSGQPLDEAEAEFHKPGQPVVSAGLSHIFGDGDNAPVYVGTEDEGEV